MNNKMKADNDNTASVMRKAYLINVNDCTVAAISDLICHPDSFNFEAAASVMAVANKYASQIGVQSPMDIDIAIGSWVASSGFDESSTRQAKIISQSYRDMWNNGNAICVFTNGTKMFGLSE